jgi:hypothetical protein
MGEFKMPPRTLPTRRHGHIMVWLVSIGTVLLAFGILFFIGYGPHSVVHRVGPLLTWVLVLLILCAVGTNFVALRRSFERVKYDLTFVLSQSELIRKRPACPDVRISLPQIKSLYEQSGCLVVAGGDPPRTIAVPKDVENFTLLQAELMKYASLAPPPRRSSLGWITLFLTLICWWLLIWSGNINTTRAAGGGVLVLLGWWSFELRQRLLHSPKRIALWILVGSSWLLAGFLIYIRAFGGRG